MASSLTHRRPDGSFVALVDGLPYHVLPGDPLFPTTPVDLPLEPPPPPPPIPSAISDRQFAQGLALHNLITEDEALEWVSNGTLPRTIEAYVQSLPTGDRFAARMVLKGATEFRRDHPLTQAFGAATGLDIDTFWTACSTL